MSGAVRSLFLISLLSLVTLLGCSSSGAGNGNGSSGDSGSGSSPSPNGLITTPTIAADIAWDPASQRIYFSTPGLTGGGSAANTVNALDPVTSKVTLSVSALTEPGPVSVSVNGKYLYVGIKDLNLVQRLTLPSLKADLQIPLGTSPLNGPYYAWNLRASPTSDETVAIARTDKIVSSYVNGGIGIYDGATPRSAFLCGEDLTKGCKGVSDSWVQFAWNGTGDAIVARNGTSPSAMAYWPLDGSGFLDYTGPPIFNTLGGNEIVNSLHPDPSTGFVYLDDGGIVDPTGLKALGQFTGIANQYSFSPAMTLDAKRGKAYFLVDTKDAINKPDIYAIKVFDLKTHALLATVPVSSDALPGMPKKIIRWGTNGLAFTMLPTMLGTIEESQPSAIYTITSDSF